MKSERRIRDFVSEYRQMVQDLREPLLEGMALNPTIEYTDRSTYLFYQEFLRMAMYIVRACSPVAFDETRLIREIQDMLDPPAEEDDGPEEIEGLRRLVDSLKVEHWTYYRLKKTPSSILALQCYDDRHSTHHADRLRNFYFRFAQEIVHFNRPVLERGQGRKSGPLRSDMNFEAEPLQAEMEPEVLVQFKEILWGRATWADR